MDEIDGLEEKYAVLAAKIDELDPEHVFITEYPTAHFDRKDDGTVGRGCGVFLQVSRSTVKKIKQLATKLNQEIEKAARKHEWRFGDDIVEGFRGHGYCRDDERYFVTFSESRNRTIKTVPCTLIGRDSRSTLTESPPPSGKKWLIHHQMFATTDYGVRAETKAIDGRGLVTAIRSATIKSRGTVNGRGLSDGLRKQVAEPKVGVATFATTVSVAGGIDAQDATC